MAPRITLAGSLPPDPADGLSPLVAEFLDYDTGRQMRVAVGLISTSHKRENWDKGNVYPVVTWRHIEVASDPDDVKALTEILGRLFGNRTAIVELPFEPGDRMPDPDAILPEAPFVDAED
jgi:hypothetical protein